MNRKTPISQCSVPQGRKALLPTQHTSQTFYAPLALPPPPPLPPELHETARPSAALSRRALVEEVERLRQENDALVESLAQATRALDARESRTVSVRGLP